ncbi:isochorismatase family protein [Haliea sp. E1-2-M8]|uniref:isochorismatase family protein n=1 Tax=Haliea sp. E1-2-M8 TaxID=3064706 RepID=UPI0027178C98|nr:isochorismatase family protein [Haliea sp. E1-2-M8]MDO8861506.1 isochorismatase family protein [Haliea sp. E1-2-M8]
MDLERIDLGLGERPALLLVDLVRGFTDPACPLGAESGSVIAANQTLLQAFHARHLPVFFTTVVYSSPDQARVFRDRVPALDLLQPGSPWVEVDPALPFAVDDVLLEKQWASAFHRTGLHQQLQARGVDSLVVTGLTTSGCVRATVVDGLQYDYRVVVVREAVGDRNADAHRANLHDMQAKYADVVALESMLAMLPGDGTGG